MIAYSPTTCQRAHVVITFQKSSGVNSTDLEMVGSNRALFNHVAHGRLHSVICFLPNATDWNVSRPMRSSSIALIRVISFSSR
jgi:hypothetical protein